MNKLYFQTLDSTKSWLARPLEIKPVAGSAMIEINGVQGYMLPGDLQLLFQTGLNLPENGAYLEIGSWLGMSALAVANGCLANVNLGARIYCVDTWRGSAEHSNMEIIKADRLYYNFQENIQRAGMSHFINPLRAKSTDIAKQWEDSSLDVVFIDGDHSFEACLADIEAWLPKLKPSGRLMGHDATPDGGVKKALLEFKRKTRFDIVIYNPPAHHYMWELLRNTDDD